MASQEILVTYKAEVDQLTQELKKIVAAQDQITKEQKEGQAQINKNITNQELAAKNRLELLKLEEKELVKLKQLRALAFDPKVIKDYDTQINKSLANIKLLGGKTKEALGGIGSSIKSIGAGIAAGFAASFTVGAAINFGKASVNAFLEADKTANKLKNTIIAVNGETEKTFNTLIKQSEDLQKITVFSDDSIQQAQAALAAFGLTGDQIEELIPKLADFATIANTDIVQAAEQVGAALEGNGREFKKYGIDVDTTKSRLENFNTIVNGFVRFQGAAANAAGTFAGRLEQQRNAVDDLQEKIGQKLLPAFLKIQEFGLRAVKVIADLFGEDTQTEAEKAAETFGRIAVEFNTSIEVLKRGNITQEQRKELIKEINQQYGEYLPNLLTEKSSLEDIEKAQAAVNKQLEGRILLVALEEDIVRITKNSISAARDLIQVQKDRIKAEKDLSDNAQLAIFTRDQLNQREDLANALIKTGRDELAGLQDQYAKLADQLGINISGTNKLLEAQKGVNEATDERIAGSAEEIKKLQTLSSEYAAFFELLSNEDKTQLIELSITAEAELERDAEDKIALLKEIFKSNSLELPVLVDQEGNTLTFVEQVEALNKELARNGIEVPVTVNSVALDNFRAKVAQLKIDSEKEITIEAKLSIPQDRQDVTVRDSGMKEAAESDLAIWFDRNEQILSSSEQLFSELVALSQQYTSNQIEQINERTKKQLEAFDAIQEKNQELLRKGAITERAALNNEKQLEAERVRIATEAEKKIADLKRKQFNIDKAAALIEIAINTAKAISTAIGPQAVILIPLYSALGAAQAALVASQPNPYKKGTKSSKEGLALVDEEGSEAIFSPASGRLTVLEKGTKVLPAKQTKTYGEVLDAMYDKRFDKYIMQNYVTPALNKQKATFEKTKQQRFTDNIKESIVMNGSGLTGYDLELNRRKGFNINNVDEFAQALAYHQRRSYKR